MALKNLSFAPGIMRKNDPIAKESHSQSSFQYKPVVDDLLKKLKLIDAEDHLQDQYLFVSLSVFQFTCSVFTRMNIENIK